MTIWNPILSEFSGPRYKALADAIAADILSKKLRPDQQLPTHRALADQLRVTVGTITRGYAEAERRGLLTAKIGSGTFVKSNETSSEGFFIPSEESDSLIDLSLSLTLPGNQDQILAASLKKLATENRSLLPLLNYQPESGMTPHKEAGARWLSQLLSIKIDPDQIILSNGGQHGLSIGLQALTRPGDWVVSEGLTYPGFLNAARQYHLRPVGVPMDEQGLIPDQLDSICRQYHPRVLYCNLTNHNPTTITTPLDRREQLVNVIRKHQLWVIEDDVQVNLISSPPPSLAQLCPERVIHLSSFSKGISSGLRIGFIYAPPEMIPKLSGAMRSNCWMVSPLLAEIARDWINTHKTEEIMENHREELRHRHQIVKEELSSFSWKSDAGSHNFWLQLPEHWRANEFAKQAEINGVLIKPAEAFAVGRFVPPHFVRVGVSSPTSRERLRQGLIILRQTLEDEPMGLQTTI